MHNTNGQWGTPDDIGSMLADAEYERRQRYEADLDDDPSPS